MPKYTVASKINHYHDTNCEWGGQQQQKERAMSRMMEEEDGGRRARPVSQSILSTKSLANLITITRRPLEPAERRKPRQLDDNHYHHKHESPINHHDHDDKDKDQQQRPRQCDVDDDETRDHLKPLRQLHHRKQKRIIRERQLQLQKQQQQQQQQTKLNNNNNNNSAIKTRKAEARRSMPATRLATRRAAMSQRQNSELAMVVALVSVLVALVGLMAGQAEGLDCYHCSSVDDPGCDESFASRANYTETDCRKHLGPDKSAKVCRKIVQYIEHKKVVIRSCGYIDEHDDKDKKPMCYKRSGTFAIMMESCNCYENNCNSTLSLVPNLSVLSSVVLICSLGLATVWVGERKKLA